MQGIYTSTCTQEFGLKMYKHVRMLIRQPNSRPFRFVLISCEVGLTTLLEGHDHKLSAPQI